MVRAGLSFLAAIPVMAAVVTPGPPPPLCSGFATLGSLIGSSCSVGIFEVSDVSYSGPGAPAAGAIGLSIFATTGANFALVFTADFAGPGVFTIEYRIDPPPDVIQGLDFAGDFGFQFVGPLAAAVTVDTEVCPNDDFAGPLCTPGTLTNQISDLVPTGSIAVFPLVPMVDVRHTITASAGASLLELRVDLLAVPEPGTAGLAGLALVALGISGWAARNRGRGRGAASR